MQMKITLFTKDINEMLATNSYNNELTPLTHIFSLFHFIPKTKLNKKKRKQRKLKILKISIDRIVDGIVTLICV